MHVDFSIRSGHVSGCAPDRSGSVQATLVVWQEDAGQYQPQVVEVGPLESLRELRGRDIEFRAFTSIAETPNGQKTKTTLGYGVPFNLSWVETGSGQVLAAEYSSLIALTLYRNIEVTIAAFRAQGWVPTQRIRVVVNPRWDATWLGDQRGLHTDNAALGRFNGQFLFLAVPPALTPGLPLSTNLGVTGHEIGHCSGLLLHRGGSAEWSCRTPTYAAALVRTAEKFKMAFRPFSRSRATQ